MSRPQPGFAAVDPPERWAPTRGRFRPERLEAPLDSLPGVGPTLKKRLAKLGLERIGDLLDHRPRRYERPAPGEADRRPLRRRGGTDRGRGDPDVAAARPRPAPDPDRAGLGRQRPDQRDLVQPALAAGEAEAGHARAPARRAEPLRLRRALVRPQRGLRDGRLRAGLSRERGDLGREAARARRGGAAARHRPSRPASGPSEGRARAAAPRRRAGVDPQAALARGGGGGEAAARLRRAAGAAARAGPANGRAGAAGRRRAARSRAS